MAGHIYSLLLLVYPKWFRESHEEELLAIFRECYRECRKRGGVMSWMSFWLGTAWDAVSNGTILRFGADSATAREKLALESHSRGGWLFGWGNDFRYALRQLLRAPGFSAAVILILGLGIGANTTLFGVVQSVLLRPLPFNDADAIVILGEFTPSVDTQFVSPVTFADWNGRQEVFQQLAAHRHWQNVNLEDGFGDPEPIDLVTPTANFFAVMGIRPLIGRVFKEEQSSQGGSEAVLSYEFWQRRYGGRADMLGKSIRIRGTLATVVGIMPPVSANLALGWGDVWTCLYRYNVEQMRATSYQSRYLSVVGHLRPGVTLEQARDRMAALQHQLWQERTSVAAGYEVRLDLLPDLFLGRLRAALQLLFCGVVLILLITCANVANLLLARSAARRRETAIRLAIGANCQRLLRLLLSEAIVLALAGGALGAALAWAALDMLPKLGPEIPRIREVAFTPEAFAFAAGVSTLCAVLFGVAPGVQVRRTNLGAVLKEGGRTGSGGALAVRARRLLVASQVALCCLLLTAGVLLLRSLQELLVVDPGFKTENALMFDLYLPGTRYPASKDQTRFYRDLMRTLEETPGVASAGGLLYFPMKPKLWLSAISIEASPVPEGSEPVVYFNEVMADYFSAMRIPLIAGRWPTEKELWEDRRAVLINQSMARQLFPGETVLGRRIRTGTDSPWLEVIGIVGDVRQKNLSEPPRPEFYTTFAGMPMPFSSIVVRTSMPAKDMFGFIRAAVRRVDPGLAVADLTLLENYVQGLTADRRFAMTLVSALAVLASGLAAVGIYGIVSLAVAQRRREISVRLAIGAQPDAIRRMILRDGLKPAVWGGILGLGASLVTAQAMQHFLYGVRPTDPFTFASSAAAITLIALFASWWPARSASRIQAVSVLREE